VIDDRPRHPRELRAHRAAFIQIDRVMKINDLQTITDDVVEAARSTSSSASADQSGRQRAQPMPATYRPTFTACGSVEPPRCAGPRAGMGYPQRIVRLTTAGPSAGRAVSGRVGFVTS
jgi:hypothetical protein